MKAAPCISIVDILRYFRLFHHFQGVLSVRDKLLHGIARISVVCHYIQLRRRHGNNMSAGISGINNLAHRPDTSDNQLAFVAPQFQPIYCFFDNFGRITAFVRDPSRKETHISGARFCSQHDLAEG